MTKQYLEAGKAVTTHGIHGEVKVYPWSDSPQVLCKLKRLFLDDRGCRALEVISARAHKNMALIRFKGCDTVEQARQLVDRVLYLDRAEVGLPEDAHFIADLIGLSVVDAARPEQVYGELVDVTNNGAHDVYHIRLADGRLGYLPAAGGMVSEIDISAGTMKIRPVKGLLDDAD